MPSCRCPTWPTRRRLAIGETADWQSALRQTHTGHPCPADCRARAAVNSCVHSYLYRAARCRPLRQPRCPPLQPQGDAKHVTDRRSSSRQTSGDVGVEPHWNQKENFVRAREAGRHGVTLPAERDLSEGPAATQERCKGGEAIPVQAPRRHAAAGAPHTARSVSFALGW